MNMKLTYANFDCNSVGAYTILLNMQIGMRTHQRIESLSQFGIGFASCFLAADHVVVETKRADGQAILLDMYDLLWASPRHAMVQGIPWRASAAFSLQRMR